MVKLLRGDNLKNFQYDVSIVIPVYNSKEYIPACFSSILKQKYNFNKIQVIFIDDGSIDDSLKICKNIASKYKNVKVLSQKNSGVSTTRNNGIRNSLGKYIMLLDSDDYISRNTVKNLFNFFEKHYNEIDILTYPIKFDRHGKIFNNERYDQYIKGTGIYDINELIYLNQSTVNIMIKNEYENTNLYNVNMKLSEDQNFDTEQIMKKEKLGFVKEATYYYRRYDASVSQSRNNPYYCFDDIMSYNELLLKKYKRNGKIPKYIQSLVINTMKWRIKTDELFPYYLEGENYTKAVDRIKKIIRQIDVDVIMGVPDMELYHKLYFLTFSNHKLSYEFNKNICVYCDKELIHKSSKITGQVCRLKLKNNQIKIMADLFNPLFEIVKPKIYIEKVYKEKKQVDEIDIRLSNDSCYMAKFKVTNVYNFDIDFNIQDLKSFKIYAMINDRKINIQFKFKKFASNNFIKEKYNILYSKNDSCFKIRKKNILNILKSRLRNFISCMKKNKKAVLYRIMYYLYPNKKNIWVYTDMGNALDNAYVQFKNDYNKNDHIKRYYISKFDTTEINKNFDSNMRKSIVKQGSLKHKMLYLHSNKIITSFVDLQVYCPFNTSIYCYNDLTNYDLIYLQHGILHSNLVKMYAKEYTEIDKFVISTHFEHDNLINKYHYKEEDLLKSGMPRMIENKNIKTKNKILFAPSWRKYLIGNLVKNKRKLKKNEFINSKFYKEIYNFLHSELLQKYLEEKNFILEFKLHPIFREYSNLFDIKNNKNIKIDFNKINISEYKVFITDFSSFQFDFVKLKRPIIYFMPDMEEFKAGLHTYRELDLKYEDAFGNLFTTCDGLFGELKKIIDNNCKVDQKYLDRMDDFFLEINNPKEDIYNCISKL